jgi:hypothetical protein
MHEITPATSNEINRLHQLASKTAAEAVEHAKQAGELLMKVKAQLRYGQFIQWIDENLTVSPRQAQRYMAVAQGKTIPVRELAAKYDTVSQVPRNDTVSHLSNIFSSEEIDRLVDGTWVACWKPKTGHWYTTVTEKGEYWVVPDLKRPDQFHVSRLFSDDIEDDESLFSGTRWAESADRVEITLRGFLLSAPENAVWKEFKRAGLTEPFGAPENHGKIKVIGKDGQERWIRDAS